MTPAEWAEVMLSNFMVLIGISFMVVLAALALAVAVSRTWFRLKRRRYRRDWHRLGWEGELAAIRFQEAARRGAFEAYLYNRPTPTAEEANAEAAEEFRNVPPC